jgi:hypothetical protein
LRARLVDQARRASRSPGPKNALSCHVADEDGLFGGLSGQCTNLAKLVSAGRDRRLVQPSCVLAIRGSETNVVVSLAGAGTAQAPDTSADAVHRAVWKNHNTGLLNSVQHPTLCSGVMFLLLSLERC